MTGWRRRFRRSVASSPRMSQAGEGSRKPESAKGRGSGGRRSSPLARRSPRHSSLFWFLFDQHDQLIEAKRHSGLGIPWESMLPRFAALNLTLWKGKADHAQGRPADVLARAEEEGAAGRAGSQGGGRARVPARARSSAEYALALHRIVHRRRCRIVNRLGSMRARCLRRRLWRRRSGAN